LRLTEALLEAVSSEDLERAKALLEEREIALNVLENMRLDPEILSFIEPLQQKEQEVAQKLNELRASSLRDLLFVRKGKEAVHAYQNFKALQAHISSQGIEG
jgi:hypothetical protein